MSSHLVLVTGATGYVGSALCHHLIQHGYWVRAFGLPGSDVSDLQHPNIEIVLGDLLEPSDVKKALEGCQAVIHLGAYAKNWAKDSSVFYQINRDATWTLFEHALSAGVKRVVYTSTIVTYGPTLAGQIGDETLKRDLSREPYLTDYEASKAESESKIPEFIQRGLEIITVHPTRVYGPGKATEGNSVSKMIDLYEKGLFSTLLAKGCPSGNYVFIEDLVQGHRLALQKGKNGEHYILGGENASLKQFFDYVDAAIGENRIRIPFPGFLALFFARIEVLKAKLFNTYPLISPSWVETFLRDWNFTSNKAIQELGYSVTPLRDGIQKTWEWIQARRKKTPYWQMVGSVVAILLMVTWKYYGHLGFTRGESAYSVSVFFSAFVLFFIVPALMVRFLIRLPGLSFQSIGLQPGNWKESVKWSLIAIPIFGLSAISSTSDLEMQMEYPLHRSLNGSVGQFTFHALTYLLFYWGWEFFFRGFLQRLIALSSGPVIAVLFQTLASVLLHIGKPGLETYGSLMGGLFWGWFAWHTGSIYGPMFIHAFLGIFLDFWMTYMRV